jgi:hypothetical protein
LPSTAQGAAVPPEPDDAKTAGPAPQGRWRALHRRLHSPRLILVEIVAITLAGVVVAVVPQVGVEGADRLAQFRLQHPTLEPILEALGLHAVAGSWVFAGLFLLAAASLASAVVEQWRRARREGSLPLGPESFRSAAYRREVKRPRAPGAALESRATYATSGRLGLFGSPAFHAGLLILVLAGLLRMLLAQDAAVDLLEGETLPPEPAAYGAQWGGPLAVPFALAFPLRLETLTSERWPDGALKSFMAQVTLETPRGPRAARLAVNTPLDVGSARVFLSALHGPAALLEADHPGGTERVAVLLRPVVGRQNAFQGSVTLRSGLEVRLRSGLGPDAGPPTTLETRILDGGALLFAGPLKAGAEVALGARGTVALPAIRSWAQFRGSRDRALPLAYLGFALAIVGATAMFTLVRVDTAVLVTPLADGQESVVVALRAPRLAPLFAERFEALAREHLGGGPAKAIEFLAAPSAADGQVGRGCQYPTPAASSARDRQSPRAAKQNGKLNGIGRPSPAGEEAAPTAHGRRGGTAMLAGAALLSAGLAAGCGSADRLSDERAERLVRAYNQRLADAYRTSDPELLEGVAGPAECRKVLGLIGVKSDQGISLDATLLSLALLSVAPGGEGTVVVTTEETWRYADRRIGTGDVVGEPSEDHYRISYRLDRLKAGGWVVGEVRFATPPVVGRAAALNRVPISAHAAPAATPP